MRPESVTNAYARYKYLVNGIKDNSLVANKDIDSLSSQRAFAGMSISGMFGPLSLNTLKSAANQCLDDKASGMTGFEYLNNLRADLYATLKWKSNSKDKNKTKRSEEFLKKIKNERDKAECHNLVLTKAYSELLASFQALSHDENIDQRTRQRFNNVVERHLEIYGAIIEPDLSVGQERLSVIKGGRS